MLIARDILQIWLIVVDIYELVFTAENGRLEGSSDVRHP